MANVGDKYIIELTKRYNDRSFYVEGIDRVVTIKELDKLEKYNKEYIADCENVYDKGFKDGLEKAWEMVKRIFIPKMAYEKAYKHNELDMIFGEISSYVDLAQMTAFEVMDKVELYEKQKAEKDKIKVGNEVRLDTGTNGVVVYSDPDGPLNIVTAFGGMRCYDATKVIKTGRHFPQMVKMMKEMRDNDESAMRAIDAEKLKRKPIEGDGHDDDRFMEGYNFAINEIREYIDNMPTVEAEPVKHGRWIDNGSNMWLCSYCKENLIYSETKIDRAEKQRYCSRCGARMDGENNE